MVTRENIEEKLQDWKTTDPRNHNPESFAYFLHEFSKPDWKEEDDVQRTNYFDEDGKLIHDSSNWGINLEIPERFTRKELVALNYVTDAFIGTMGYQGVIVEAPLVNLLYANNEFLSPNLEEYEKEKYNILKNKITPSKLINPNLPYFNLKNPILSGINEVAVKGYNPKFNTEIKIIGGYRINLNSISFSIPDHEEDAKMRQEKIKNFCNKQNLPLVDLPKEYFNAKTFLNYVNQRNKKYAKFSDLAILKQFKKEERSLL